MHRLIPERGDGRRRSLGGAIRPGLTVRAAALVGGYLCSGYTPACARGFKGNKAGLPSKPCVACGRAMSWRKAWAKNWVDVRYCSDACRKNRKAASDS